MLPKIYFINVTQQICNSCRTDLETPSVIAMEQKESPQERCIGFTSVAFMPEYRPCTTKDQIYSD